MKELKLHDYDEYQDNGELLVQNDVQSTDVQEQTPSQDNWNFYNQMQATQPQTSRGGKNFTKPTSKSFQKKRRINKTQRNSRRINRKK